MYSKKHKLIRNNQTHKPPKSIFTQKITLSSAPLSVTKQVIGSQLRATIGLYEKSQVGISVHKGVFAWKISR